MNSQLQEFRENGYCLVDNLYTEAELLAMEAFFESYKECGNAVFDKGHHFHEQDPAKMQIRAMHPHRYSSQVQGWFLKGVVMDALHTLLGKEALGAQTMYYYKPPGAKGQGMHQDNFYLLAKPATCIAAWTPIDEATLENGCLWIVPGSHRDAIYCPEETSTSTWNNYGDSHIKPFPRKATPIPVPVKRGQTLFFGGNLIHGSGPNRTKDRFRRTFIGHYVDQSTDSLAKFYHPVLDRNGKVVSSIEVPVGGGPCGDGWNGAVH